MKRANDKVGWKEDGKVFPSKASLLLAFVQTIILEYLCQIPFLPFYCLPVYGWHNLVSQGIIRLNSDSRTVSDVLLMQHNYPSHKAEGIFVECVFPFFCITPAGKTSLLLQHFNEGNLIQVSQLFLWTTGDPQLHKAQCFEWTV